MLPGTFGWARVRRFWEACWTLGESPDAAPCRALGDASGHATGDLRAPRQPTGVPKLDAALGGGLPKGRVVLVNGGMGAGKTRLCQALTAHAQKRHQVAAAWLDLDHSLHAADAQALGMAASTLVLPCADPCKAISMATALLRDGHVSWLVIDPWPPLPGPQPARQALRGLARAAAVAEAVVLITQPCWDAVPKAHVPTPVGYIASTHLHLVATDTSRLRRDASGTGRVLWATRITVTKPRGKPGPNGAPKCTFIVPIGGVHGSRRGLAANSWRYI